MALIASMTLLTVAYLFLGSISDFGLNMQSSVKHGASYVVEHKEEVVSPSVEKSEEENPDLEDKLEKAKEKEEGKRKDAKQKSQQSQPNSLPKNPKDESSPPKSSPSQSSSQSSPKSSSHPSSSSSSSTPSSKTTLPSSSLSPSSVSFSSHWNHSTEAYLFVLTNDKPMHLIWALEASLRNVSSTRRRIALVTDGVSHSIRQVLEKLDIEVRRIPNLSHPKFKVTEARWKDTLSKLAIFDQTDLTKFFYLDADIIINYNMDDLFELDTDGMIHAMRDNSGCFNDVPKLNAGLMIGSPSPTLKKNLLNALDDPENPTKDGMGDQDLLNFYLNKHKMIGFRPEVDMAFLWRCSCVLERKTPTYNWKETRAIHFTGWYMDIPALVRDGITSRTWDPPCAYPWYQRWVYVHNQLKIWWEQRYGSMPEFPVVKM